VLVNCSVWKNCSKLKNSSLCCLAEPLCIAKLFFVEELCVDEPFYLEELFSVEEQFFAVYAQLLYIAELFFVEEWFCFVRGLEGTSFSYRIVLCPKTVPYALRNDGIQLLSKLYILSKMSHSSECSMQGHFPIRKHYIQTSFLQCLFM